MARWSTPIRSRAPRLTNGGVVNHVRQEGAREEAQPRWPWDSVTCQWDLLFLKQTLKGSLAARSVQTPGARYVFLLHTPVSSVLNRRMD